MWIEMSEAPDNVVYATRSSTPPRERQIIGGSRRRVSASRRGFTLLETLIVVGIIAVLVSIIAISINVVRKNASTRATRVAMENAITMQNEMELNSPLPSSMKITSAADPTKTANDAFLPDPDPDRTDRVTRRMAVRINSLNKNRQTLEKLAAGSTHLLIAPEWASGTRYVAGDVVLNSGYFFRARVEHVATGANGPLPHAADFAQNPNQNVNWIEVVQPPAAIPTDGWGTGLRFVGLTLANLTSSAGVTEVTAPDKRPFWVSAGPDTNFATHDDNVYSFEN
ncbi:MAG TPA: type II secretion system protein [Tepidisphaeraceae bacterium]